MADIQTVMQKQRAGIPLTPEESALLAPAAPKTQSILDPAKYGINQMAEQQYSPEELEQILGLSSGEEEQDAMARQMQQAEALRSRQVPEQGRIQMSSGTSYTPPTSDGAMWANILAQGVGQYKMNKLEKRDAEERAARKAARTAYGKKVLMPDTAYEKEVKGAFDPSTIAAPQVDLGEPQKLPLADRLRSFRRKYMTV